MQPSNRHRRPSPAARGAQPAAHGLSLPVAGCLLGVFLFVAGCTSWPEKPMTPSPLETHPESLTPRNNAQALKGDGSEGKSKSKKNAKEAAAAALVEYTEQLMKGKESEKRGDLKEARAIYESLIAGHPKRYEAYHRLAVLADRQRRYQEAQALYTQAIRLNNRNPDLFNDLGYCFYLEGKLDKAESAFLKAVAMRPAEARYRNNLGLAYGMQGRDEKALEQYRRAGSEGDAYYNLAFVKASRNDFAAAKDCFRRAVAVDPTHDRAQQALASFEAAENEPEYLHNTGPRVDAGVTWVPYVENDDHQNVAAPQAAAKPSAVSPRAATSARSATHGLIGKAQAYSAAGSDTAPR